MLGDRTNRAHFKRRGNDSRTWLRSYREIMISSQCVAALTVDTRGVVNKKPSYICVNHMMGSLNHSVYVNMGNIIISGYNYHV